jgi:hypothetical protein
MGILLYLSAAFYFFTFIFSYAAGAAAFIISIITHIVLVLTVFFGSLSFASVDVAKPPAFQLFLFFAFIFLITLIKSKKRFAAGAILIFINSAYLAVPACYDRGKTKVDFYYSKNAAAVYVKDGSGEHFTLYQTGKYYDKYFIEAFGRFVKYKGIKKPDVLAVGFKESHLQDFDFEVTSRR